MKKQILDYIEKTRPAPQRWYNRLPKEDYKDLCEIKKQFKEGKIDCSRIHLCRAIASQLAEPPSITTIERWLCG